ncbi:STAS domain-containing protein [Streptomyces sp. SYSU K21746]
MRTQVLGQHASVGAYTDNGWTVLEPAGEVDICFSPRIRAAVIGLLRDGHRHFVLDLRLASFLDSTGLGMIVAVTKRIRDHKGSLRIACADEWLLKVFRMGGLRHVYAFHGSAEEAISDTPTHNGLAHWPHLRH